VRNLRLLKFVRHTLSVGHRYLWVALQLETLFPRYDPLMVSDAEIFGMITSLPKDLSEAFERALQRVSDPRHGSKIFKLVAAADPPLTLDELNVALSVEPGNTIWDPTSLLRNPPALVSAWAGALLEIDEDESHVQFIHHSALMHLLSASMNPATARYHFSLEDASLEMGSVCVTYLSYNLFDTRVSANRKVSGGPFAETLTKSALSSVPLGDRVHDLWFGKAHSPSVSLDFMRAAAVKISSLAGVEAVRCFMSYASTRWLEHTRLFGSITDLRIYSFWKQLVEGAVTVISLPYEPGSKDDMFLWAICAPHEAIFRDLLRDEYLHDHLIKILVSKISSNAEGFRLRGDVLSDILARCIYVGCLDWNVLEVLIRYGADPTKPARVGNWETSDPLCLILSKMTANDSRDFEVVIHLVELLHQSARNGVLITPESQASALITAVERGWLDAVTLLLNYKYLPSPISEERSPLGVAIRNKDTLITLDLLKKKADPRWPDVDWTAAASLIDRTDSLGAEIEHLMEEACAAPQLGSWKTVVQQAAARNDWSLLANFFSGSALHLALCRRDTRSVKQLLLITNADINACDLTVPPLLHLAVKLSDVAMVELLLDSGAKPDIVDKTFPGGSALHVACERILFEHMEMVISRLLVGSDINIPNRLGYLPLDIAMEQGNEHAERLLRVAGAKSMWHTGRVSWATKSIHPYHTYNTSHLST
jgi:hypothetical protein